MSARNESLPFTISRTFDAPRDLVWKAWTEREHLKRWFGPTGATIVQADIDLRPGGVFLYCMRGAMGGKDLWGKWTFMEIVPPEKLVVIVSFSDATGGITRHPLAPDWPLQTLSTTTFAEKGGKTLLTLEWGAYQPTVTEQATFDAGHDSMRGGWGGTMDRLDAYLAQAKTPKA